MEGVNGQAMGEGEVMAEGGWPGESEGNKDGWEEEDRVMDRRLFRRK